MFENQIEKAPNFFSGEAFDGVKKFKSFLEEKQKVIVKQGERRQKILIGCRSFGVLESMKKLLEEHEISFLTLSSIEEITKLSNKYIGLCIYELSEGFETKDLLFISDEMLIGKQISSIKKRRELNLHKLKIATNQFEKGDLVVHKEYGIGLFEGVLTIETAGIKNDAIKLIYRGGDVLYIPVYNINTITKYGGEVPAEEREGLLDKLGGNSFKLRKAKAKLRIFAIAEGLMKVAAKRNLIKAKIFIPSEEEYQKFAKDFPFELTDDQTQAIEDIFTDLSSGKPMDRLVCGDVGFGKTEVAMRATFAVCFQKKGQTAVIVPTTILARQHFNNFTERFKNTDVKIRELSRNISTKERAEIMAEAEVGELDVLIGTHALFSEKLKFKNLELLIIDEEQHFGVKQKEKLKEGKEGIHFLALSATPIPRTLQMSLSGIKSISIIATPPFDRLLPKTFLMHYDLIVLTSAIIREKMRGGRTFFVCPRISDLEEQKAKLELAIPEVRFGIAHGRMTGNMIEDIMLDFYEGKIDVLITTSIIESGIDISFANTIIIYKAEMFGLSQIYQLRGRVGRGSVQSYAYFIATEGKVLEGSNAKNRLQTLASIKSLGAGFGVAGADMDIRGAGNLIGEEQSGKINDVGVELYQEMLKSAIEKLQNSEEDLEDDFSPEIKIGMGVMIPEKYIPDFNLRLEFYRRISAVSSLEELALLNEEMADRFGSLPESVANLIDMIKIKIRCKKLGISKIEVGVKGIVIIVKEKIFTAGEKLFEYTIKNPKLFKISPEGKVNYYDENQNLNQKVNKFLTLIESFSSKN